MKLLLTNDDGIDAPGLATLKDVLDSFGEVSVVAPAEHLSGCSHQVSTHRPVRLNKLAEGRHALDGTPADCTRLGLLHLVPEADWVMAGINDGGNLGVDVYMSGTVAAVREAALMGKPGIAFSQYRKKGEPLDWNDAGQLVSEVLRRLWALPAEPGTFWNVNLPHLNGESQRPEIIFCPLDSAHLPMQYQLHDGQYHYRGDYQNRPRKAGSDVDVCFSGQIAVTQIRLNGSA